MDAREFITAQEYAERSSYGRMFNNVISSHNNLVSPVMTRLEEHGRQIKERESQMESLAAKMTNVEQRVNALNLEQARKSAENRAEMGRLQHQTEDAKTRIENLKKESDNQMGQLRNDLESLAKADKEREKDIARFTAILNDLKRGRVNK